MTKYHFVYDYNIQKFDSFLIYDGFSEMK